jgi:hypothetical protein
MKLSVALLWRIEGKVLKESEKLIGKERERERRLLIKIVSLLSYDFSGLFPASDASAFQVLAVSRRIR